MHSVRQILKENWAKYCREHSPTAHQNSEIQKMIDCASIVLWSRDEGKLVGIALSLTYFSYCCYLSDLAVDWAYRGRGIGRELIARTQEIIGEESMLLLLEAPMAKGYYEHVGFEKIENGWILHRKR